MRTELARWNPDAELHHLFLQFVVKLDLNLLSDSDIYFLRTMPGRGPLQRPPLLSNLGKLEWTMAAIRPVPYMAQTSLGCREAL